MPVSFFERATRRSSYRLQERARNIRTPARQVVKFLYRGFAPFCFRPRVSRHGFQIAPAPTTSYQSFQVSATSRKMAIMQQEIIPAGEGDFEEPQYISVQIGVAVRGAGDFEIRSVATDGHDERFFDAAVVEDQYLEMVVGALIANRIRTAREAMVDEKRVAALP
jgi:hypothetical protein